MRQATLEDRTSFLRAAVHALFALATLALLAAKFHLIGLQNINWDEFLFLSWLYDYRRGELATGLQTFHVHLIGWLAQVPGSSVDQVLAGRIQAFVLRVGASICVFLIGRRLVGSSGAWIAVLASLTFSFVLAHGESFRADPLIAFLFLAALVSLMYGTERTAPAALAGALMALATAISIKSVFYLPTLGIVVLLSIVYDADRGRALRRALLFSLTMAAVLIPLLAYHASAIPHQAAAQEMAGNAATAAKVMWGLSQPGVLQLTLGWDHAFWVMLGIGSTAAAVNALAGPSVPDRRRAFTVLALVLPMASLLVYRNSFPYFYVCLVPAAAVACGLVAAQIEALLGRYPSMAALSVFVLGLLLVSNAVVFLRYNGDDALAPQRQLLAGIAEVFPQPVPYIDRCSMVSAYPKVGLFMSTLVLKRYREKGEPVMERLVRERQPVFLIANSPGLMLDLPYSRVERTAYALLQPDFEFLQANFIPHWGPLWVSGKRLQVVSEESTPFRIEVGGPYTVESAHEVMIDGVPRRPGDVLVLQRGLHGARGGAGAAGDLVLRYGAHLPVPVQSPPDGPLFTGLGFKRP